MATYRYQFCDLLSGQVIAELPMIVSSFSQQINGVGTLTGTIPLGARELAGVDWRSATQKERTIVIVLRDDVYAWGGWITKRRPTGGGTIAEITASTFEDYWNRRKIKADTTFTGADVFDVVRGIVTNLQAVANGNVRLAVTGGTSGSTTTVTYLGKDRKKALDAWVGLAQAYPFEFYVSWARTGSVWTPTLNLAAPGFMTGVDPMVIEYPGNAGDYDWPEEPAANALTGIGAQSGGAPLMVEVIDQATLDAGYPLLEDEVSWTDEADLARLGNRAAAKLAADLADNVVPSVDLRGNASPGFADIALGAPVRLRATSLYHPAGPNGVPGIDATRRITGWTVTPGPAEKVALTLTSSTGLVRPRFVQRGLPAYIADLDRRVRLLETL